MILGTIPPRIGGIKVYDKNVARNEIIMDMDLFYAGDCDINFVLGGMRGGIKDFQIHGTVRVVMKPLISKMPLVGGLQIFFLNNPNIDFNLVGVVDLLDMPGMFVVDVFWDKSFAKSILGMLYDWIVTRNKKRLHSTEFFRKQIDCLALKGLWDTQCKTSSIYFEISIYILFSGLSDILRRIIVEQIAAMMVLPNKLPIKLSDDIESLSLKMPEPEVIRFYLS